MNLDRAQLNKALSETPFTAADRTIARYLAEDLSESNNWILFAAALASLAVRQGHAFLDLAAPQDFQRSLLRFTHIWPSRKEWADWSQQSSSLADEYATTPLVFQSPNSLYLRKYFNHESQLARLLAQHCNQANPQSAAAPDDVIHQALSENLFVITGGPGTGKTTLALQYLNTFLDGWQEVFPPQIAAVAPTGKAAARLEESIRNGVAHLDAPDDRKALLTHTPTLTLHRLLGTLPNRVSFRKDARSPIDFDVLVIDECSMIDLPLMRRLFEAIPPSCKILMLGDKDQLSSVEVGSVFTDILQSADSLGSPLSGKVHQLAKTYRFSEDSSIYIACQAAKEGNFEALEKLIAAQQSDFHFHPVDPNVKRLPKSLLKKAVQRHALLQKSQTPQEALRAIARSTILTTTRVGPFGSATVNREIEHLINPRGEAARFHACPLIVLENNYELELFNGDLGIIWENADGRLEAWFTTTENEAKRVPINDLPVHETAFALTIHKSQGSEFDETVVLISPQEGDLLSRELIYTAFSRAKSSLEIFAHTETLESAIQNKVNRVTRLAEKLRSTNAASG